jgi:hypothetical protein
MSEIILSFDIGIIHLAYCLFTKKDNNWVILEWNNIDLTDREQTKCHCGLKASCTYNNNFYCKVHSKKCEPIKPFESFFKENKSLDKCQYLVKENICGKKCSFNDDVNNYYCTTHAKAKYKNLTNLYKVKPYKNSSVADLDFDKTQLKLFEILDNKKELLKANVVLLENQPSFKNPRMKSISIALYSYFLIRGIIDKNLTNSTITKVKFMSPSNKIKVVSNEETKELILLKDNETKLYKLTKELGIKYCKMMIGHLPEWLEFFEKQKKKDDLADAFLQGAYYFEKLST